MFLPIIAVYTAQAATLSVGESEGAYSTIGEAISAASSGDTIRVEPGTYPEAIDLDGKGIFLESTEGSAETIITGNGTVTLNASSDESSEAIVSGFTLQGAGHTCVTLSSVDIQIRDTIITGCGGESTFIGGAVQVNGGSPRFGNVTFSNNQAVNGGAIRAAFDADIEIDGGAFEDNSAQAGGALHLTDSSITVSNSEFSRNQATGGSGGAIWANEAALTLSETNLVDNTALFDGGAVFATESVVLISTMGAVTDNSASYGAGGALRIEGAETFNLSDSTLARNRALTLGGAVSIQETESATISGVEFEANSLGFDTGGGGALATRDSDISLATSTFSDNASEGQGGALFAVESSLEMTGVEFKTNEAVGEGGAWYQLSGWASCSGCEFTRNSSSDDGGAIWSTAEDLVIADSDVTWNESSGGNGGGLFFSGERLFLESMLFARNTGLSGGAVFTNASDHFGSMFSVYQENESVFSGGALWASGSPGSAVMVQNNDLLANECLASDGVAQLMIATGGVDVRNNLVAFGRIGAGVGGYPGIDGSVLQYNDVYGNEGGNYLSITDPTGEDGNLSVEPMLVELSIDRNFLNDNLYLQPDSPLVSAGDPEITTPDGRRSFIGAFDRIDFEDSDSDGDGFTAIMGGDCNDEDSTTYPGALERCDDDVDNDCDAEVNEDCGDTGDVDTGVADTGSADADTGTPDTGLPDQPDAPDSDDRTPSDGASSEDSKSPAYEIGGEGCSCSAQNTTRRSGVLWLLSPLLIWVRRR